MYNNSITYSSRITACEKGVRWREVSALAGGMAMESFDNDTIIYSAAMNACAKLKV